MLVALICFSILAGVYALLLKFLWSNPPQWLRLPKFSSLVIRDFGILVLSILPIVVIFTIYTLFVTGLKQSFADLKTLKLGYDIFLLKFWWLWLISAAYLYDLFMKKNKYHQLSVQAMASPTRLGERGNTLQMSGALTV